MLKVANQELANKLPIERIDIIPNKAFLLKNVLSLEECEHYINQSEEEGYLDLNLKYRTNTRVQIESQELSEICYQRILPFIPQTMQLHKEDSESTWKHLNESMTDSSKKFDLGEWEVESLNDHWRFCKYTAGGYFAPHTDACFISSMDHRSILTFNLYLNKTDGGTTNFVDGEKRRVGENKILYQVQPEPGMALVFVHWLLHEGSTLTSGVKYLMRSDVMYRRKMPSSSKEAQAFALVKQAEDLESKNEPYKAVEYYRKAIKLYPDIEKYI